MPALDYYVVSDRLKAINNTGYYIKSLILDSLDNNLFLPFNELTSIKKKIISILNGPETISNPITVPFLTKPPELTDKPNLGVLISSKEDIFLTAETSATFFFELPNILKDQVTKYIELFSGNVDLIPWFPSVLIGENYTAAIDVLDQIRPKQIVTNNTGIAYAAYKRDIPWIAGPCLNTTNSFTLLCLKEEFNCQGAFISNELSKKQIKSIIRPATFDLYYSIYHPIQLLSSRQCLHHQVSGCDKNQIDDECLRQCNKLSTLTTLNGTNLFVTKTQNNYPSLYNNINFMNTNCVTDFPGIFSGFHIDLRDIETETVTELDKTSIIELFTNLLCGLSDPDNDLSKRIKPTTHSQYKKGI